MGSPSRGVGRRSNRPDYEIVASYTSGALQLMQSIVTSVALVAFVALVSLIALVSLVFVQNQFYFVILSAPPLCHSERQRRISYPTA